MKLNFGVNFRPISWVYTVFIHSTPLHTTDFSVHGNWAEWDEWSDCLAECGDGREMRTRMCDSPAPANGGNPCPRDNGVELQYRACNVRSCAEQHVPWCEYDPCLEVSFSLNQPR